MSERVKQSRSLQALRQNEENAVLKRKGRRTEEKKKLLEKNVPGVHRKLAFS